MRAIATIAALAVRQNARSPLITGLLVLTPIMLIFVIGESLRNVLPTDNPFEHITLIVLMQAIAHSTTLALWNVHKDTHQHTLGRVSIAPLSATAFASGCFVASVLSITAFMSAVTAGAVAFLDVVPGRSPLLLFVVIVCGSTFSAALGTAAGSVFREERSAAGVITMLVPALILLGGGYFPIPDKGPLSLISPLTPYRWVYDALRSLFQPENHQLPWEMVLLCLPVAALLLLLSAAATRRRWR